MLVLSRKAGEKLVIGDNVTVEVVRISGNRITLGVVAPKDVKVLRSELKKDAKQSPAKQAIAAESSEALTAEALEQAFRLAS